MAHMRAVSAQTIEQHVHTRTKVLSSVAFVQLGDCQLPGGFRTCGSWSRLGFNLRRCHKGVVGVWHTRRNRLFLVRSFCGPDPVAVSSRSGIAGLGTSSTEDISRLSTGDTLLGPHRSRRPRDPPLHGPGLHTVNKGIKVRLVKKPPVPEFNDGDGFGPSQVSNEPDGCAKICGGVADTEQARRWL